MKTLTRKDIYTPITALFIIAKTCKQPKYPSMDRWIKKLCVCVRRCVRTHTHTHTHTHGILLRNKKEINICDTIDGPSGLYAKWSRTEKDKHCCEIQDRFFSASCHLFVKILCLNYHILKFAQLLPWDVGHRKYVQKKLKYSIWWMEIKIQLQCIKLKWAICSTYIS